jgi:hypothetical protein
LIKTAATNSEFFGNRLDALGGMMVSVFGGFSLQAVFIGFSRLHSGFLKTISIKRLFFSVLLILI